MKHLIQFKNKKGQHAGLLSGGVFKKTVNSRRHLMKKFDAWGIDFDIVTALREKCLEIRLYDNFEDKLYTVPFDTFMREATVENFGHGAQAFLSRDKWIISQK